MPRIVRIFSGLLGLAFAGTASASAVPVSEPGMFGLLAAGGVVGLVIWARSRRK